MPDAVITDAFSTFGITGGMLVLTVSGVVWLTRTLIKKFEGDQNRLFQELEKRDAILKEIMATHERTSERLSERLAAIESKIGGVQNGTGDQKT